MFLYFLVLVQHQTSFLYILEMRFQRISSSNLPRFSGLCVFVTAYISLFVIAGVILFGSSFRIWRNSLVVTRNSSYTNHHSRLYNNKKSIHHQGINSFPLLHVLDKWQNKIFVNNSLLVDSQNINSVPRSLIDSYWSHSYADLVNCTLLQEVTDLQFVAVGWTKIVYKGRLHGQNVAIKTVNLNGQDIQECQKMQGSTLAMCYQRAEAKILREIVLLTELAHENIVKVFGFCIPEAAGSVTLVTELGEPLDTVQLLQISWEDRLRLVLGVVHILHHLEHSPLGSLSMNDFRREQFVVVNGTLKLTDVDDLGVGEPKCSSDKECQEFSHFAVGRNITGNDNTRGLRCHNFHCIGHNSRLNIWHAGQHFVKILLPFSAPESLQPYVQDLLTAFKFTHEPHSVGDVSRILEATHDLVSLYKSGRYLNSGAEILRLDFKTFEDSDFPGMFDYHCRHSISAVNCVMSVFNVEEAAHICVQDIDCKAVVLSPQQTWTGRTVAIFKNGIGHPVLKRGFTLLMMQHLMT